MEFSCSEIQHFEVVSSSINGLQNDKGILLLNILLYQHFVNSIWLPISVHIRNVMGSIVSPQNSYVEVPNPQYPRM